MFPIYTRQYMYIGYWSVVDSGAVRRPRVYLTTFIHIDAISSGYRAVILLHDICPNVQNEQLNRKCQRIP